MMGEYDAGYENYIDAMVRQMEDMQFRIDSLQRDNAKLREELEYATRQVDMLIHNASIGDERSQNDAVDAITQLKAENAKLRELVRHMMAFVDDDDACKHCGHDVECVDAAQGELVLPYEGQCLMLDVFESRMRELGIEV